MIILGITLFVGLQPHLPAYGLFEVRSPGPRWDNKPGEMTVGLISVG